MKCKRCGKNIPAGQEVMIQNVPYCHECNKAALEHLAGDIMSMDPQGRIPEDEGFGTGIETLMSCCGADKSADQQDDEPCKNCGAV